MGAPGWPAHHGRRRRRGQPGGSARYAGQDPTTNRTGGSEMTTYAVIYERADDGGWWARAAEFPVFSHGNTREEAEQEVRAGIAFHLEGTLLDGGELPPES